MLACSRCSHLWSAGSGSHTVCLWSMRVLPLRPLMLSMVKNLVNWPSPVVQREIISLVHSQFLITFYCITIILYFNATGCFFAPVHLESILFSLFACIHCFLIVLTSDTRRSVTSLSIGQFVLNHHLVMALLKLILIGIKWNNYCAIGCLFVLLIVVLSLLLFFVISWARIKRQALRLIFDTYA